MARIKKKNEILGMDEKQLKAEAMMGMAEEAGKDIPLEFIEGKLPPEMAEKAKRDLEEFEIACGLRDAISPENGLHIPPSESKHFFYKVGKEEILIRKKDIIGAVLKEGESGLVTHLLLNNGLVIALNGRIHFDLFKEFIKFIDVQGIVDKIKEK